MTLAAINTRTLPLHGVPLRLEGAGLLVAATCLYAHMGHNWLLFLVLFLAPDLSMLAYFAGPHLGATAYNIAHTTLLPLALLGYALLTQTQTGVALAAIWLAHIGFDRLLGYGLKYTTNFSDTHLGRIGRQS